MATGIWQGRFQYIHNGHCYIFKNELPKFEQKMVAIVNPNPSYPACSNFARFKDNRNPFTYFQRMLLWKKIADFEKMQVSIFPCWHARYKIALENDFLPTPASRYWIIPVAQDDAEEDKATDLKRQGEKIHSADFEKENAEYAMINASMVRQKINRGDDAYKKYIPEAIWTLTENIFRGIDDNEYFMVPFIDDKIDIHSIQYAVESVNQSEKESYILFTITVHVSDGETEWKDESALPWWFKPARHPNGGKTFYKRAKLIEGLMKEMEFTKYLITPVFIMRDDIDVLCEYNSAFLPSVNNIKIIVNESFLKLGYYKYNFMAWLDNIDVEDNTVYLTSYLLLNDKLLNFFSGKNKNYLMKKCDDKIYAVMCDALIENAKGEIKRKIATLIDKASQDIESGGLLIQEKAQLMHLVNDVYPKIRIDYLTLLNVLRVNYDACASDSMISELRHKIGELEKQLTNELNEVENQ